MNKEQERNKKDGSHYSQSLPQTGEAAGEPDCRSCRRNFWTSALNAVIKIATIILAALGLSGFQSDD